MKNAFCPAHRMKIPQDILHLYDGACKYAEKHDYRAYKKVRKIVSIIAVDHGWDFEEMNSLSPISKMSCDIIFKIANFAGNLSGDTEMVDEWVFAYNCELHRFLIKIIKPALNQFLMALFIRESDEMLE
jgi:hypothetical protein